MTRICGDAVQGAGTDETGIAFFTSLELYRNTLSDLIELAPENLLLGRDFRSAPSVIQGQDNAISVLEDSFKFTVEYSAFIEKYAKYSRRKKEMLDVAEVAKAYYEGKKEPQYLGYTMQTFSLYIKAKK